GHAGVRKVDVLDLCSYVVQHDAALERDCSQMRSQQRKVVRRQRRQESVEFSVLALPGKRGRAIRHQRRSPYAATLVNQTRPTIDSIEGARRALGLGLI